MEIKRWSEIKDDVYDVKGTPGRDELDRDFEGLKIGLLLRKARESKNITQAELAERVNKKREYVSRLENDGASITLKALFDIVERGLGGRVVISIETD
ncbi:MAG: helix-turn-helix transcriptional regulator [Tannerellaceae bacterium]|nr:helix-turn-helix transcriptional regulator [Tannerellaceae bacterium]